MKKQDNDVLRVPAETGSIRAFFYGGVQMEKEKFLVKGLRYTPEWLLCLTVDEEGRKVVLALVRPNRTTRQFARLTYN